MGLSLLLGELPPPEPSFPYALIPGPRRPPRSPGPGTLALVLEMEEKDMDGISTSYVYYGYHFAGIWQDQNVQDRRILSSSCEFF